MKDLPKSQPNVRRLLPVMFLLVAVGGVGYYLLNSQNNQSSNNDSSSSNQSQQTEQARIAGAKAKVKLAQKPISVSGIGDVYYPEGWDVRQEPTVGILLTAINPVADRDSSGKQFNASMVLAMDSTDPSITITDYLNGVKAANARSSKNNKLINERTLTSGDGTQLNILESTYTDNSMQLRELQAIAVESGSVLVFTATTLEKDWPIYKDVIEQAITK